MTSLHLDAAGPCLAAQGSVVCIGAFDGVHRGHQAILARVKERARALGLPAIAVSFEPLPREFFASGGWPRLSSAREKFECLRAFGIDQVLLLRFNDALAAMSAEDFIDRVLRKRLAAHEVWVGEDFRFGRGRLGDLTMLCKAGATAGFHAAAVTSLRWEGERISSSRIRMALAHNEYEMAAQLLGRPYTIAGRVVRGKQLGRKLGYPTANLRLHRRVAPVKGIFVVRVHGVELHPMPGVASLGVRPTINGTEPLLEAHLFNFDRDLYGRRIAVEFVSKLREEEKFDSLDLLVKQMDCDAATARRVLGLSPLKAGA